MELKKELKTSLANFGANQFYYDFFSYWNDKLFVFEDISNTNSEITYRKINTWLEKGLLEKNDKDEATKWKKYSIKDAIWINIIEKLRDLGISINKIHKIKQIYYSKESIKTENILSENVFKSNNLLLVIDRKRADLKLTKELSESNILHEIDEDLTIINLDKLVANTINQLRKGDKYKNQHIKLEKLISNIVKEENFDVLAICKDVKNNRYNISYEREEKPQKLVDMLNDGNDYQEITLKKNGKNSKPYIKRIIKKRV